MIKYFIIITYCLFAFSNLASAQSLEEQATEKIKLLNQQIKVAEKQGIDARKEKMTVRTAEIFLEFANWDESNVDANTKHFKMVKIYKKKAQEMAQELPDFERKEVIIMLDEAIDYLKLLQKRKIIRKPIPQIDWAKVSHDGDQLTFNERPVFLADYTWKPKTPKLTEYHGQQDGFFVTPSFVANETGKIRPNITKQLAKKADGTMGFIFLNHKTVPKWALEKYGDSLSMRTDTYTAYDIDNPGARDVISKLIKGTVPYMAGKKYTELGYMLCNEPHFFTQEDVWATGPVSGFTKDKFRDWLKEKHGTIANLNILWETTYSNFKSVDIAIPIEGDLQGTPIWYDWVYFNMHRVTKWYTFLKAEIQKEDKAAKVHLKIMPTLWADNSRDHGIDLEALTELSGIIGNDAGSWNNHMWGPKEWWEEEYAFEWREMSMSYDFMKSVSPDKISFNSEAHYLSKSKSRDLYEDPPYTRATYWLAHTFGLNASQTWFWARNADGSIRKGNAGKGYAGSNNHQPRIVNELHSTMMDLNSYAEEITAMQRQRKPLRIFYSKTSAINKTEHQDDIFELYKSLFFEGIPLGFVTQNIINQQNPKNWDVVLVHKTEFVTKDELAALQSYLNIGGTVIIDKVSLKKDEYGQAHKALKKKKGQLIIVNSIEEMNIIAMNLMEEKGRVPNVIIKETNEIGTKGCTWKCVKNVAGNTILSIVNIGKSEATLDIQIKTDKSKTVYKNILTGVTVSHTPTLQPNEVLFVEIFDK